MVFVIVAELSLVPPKTSVEFTEDVNEVPAVFAVNVIKPAPPPAAAVTEADIVALPFIAAIKLSLTSDSDASSPVTLYVTVVPFTVAL